MAEPRADRKIAPETQTPRVQTRLAAKEQRELSELPAKIGALETDIATLEDALHDPDLYARDPAKFEKASALLLAKKRALEDTEHRWLELDEKQASLAAAKA